MKELRVLPEARDDVAQIWAYIAEVRSVDTADRITERIEEAYDQLVAFPESGRTRDDIGHEARSLTVKPYIIVYRVRPDAVEIMRVYHGARDVRNLYFPPSP